MFIHCLLSRRCTGCAKSLKKMEHLPDAARNLVTYNKVEECIVGFKDSLPLIASLKNDVRKMDEQK